MELNIGILCSGNLGLDSVKTLSLHFKPQFIFTDKNSIDIIEYATQNSIPLFIGNPRKIDPSKFLIQFNTDLIFSINYLFIVEKNILNHPNLFAINLHGSLLPKYRGRTPHVWAIINGEKETGITAHIMEEGCDTGDIVLQERITITQNNTGANILDTYKEKYPQMIIEIINQINSNKLIRLKQANRLATYFGKRTPEDGQINWGWQKERIHNWIRAQSFPYPGAFSILNGVKVIIDEISFSDFGFEDSMPNGLIIQDNSKVLVKTPNGVIELTKIRDKNNLEFKPNNKFE